MKEVIFSAEDYLSYWKKEEDFDRQKEDKEKGSKV